MKVTEFTQTTAAQKSVLLEFLSLIPVLMLYVFFALPRVAERLIVGCQQIPGFGEGLEQ
jgi:hypothetical protein